MTITIIRPGGTDAYGDPTGTDEREELRGAFVAPRKSVTSGESSQRGRQGVVIGLTLYAPPGTSVTFSDRIEVDGVEYEVEGEPGVWDNPLSGARAGVEVALRRAQG